MDERMRVLLPAFVSLAFGSWAIIAGVPPLISARAQVIDYGQPHHHEMNRVERVPGRLWEDPVVVLKRHASDMEDDHAGRVELADLHRALNAEGMSWDKTLVLGALLRQGHSAEDSETRVRTRHAIVAALQHANYSPRSTDHVGLVVIRHPAAENAEDEHEQGEQAGTHSHAKATGSHKDARTLDMHIPFEIYRPHESPRGAGKRTGHRGAVLVVWFDEHSLGREPLRLLAHVKRKLDTKLFCIVGPTNSSTLVAMLQEERRPEATGTLAELKGVQIYSPWATISMDALPDGLEKKRGDGTRIRDFTELEIHPHVGTDAALIECLLHELSLRRSDPRQEKKVVLIIESDSDYGRGLYKSFVREIAKAKSKNVEHPDYYTYIRGLDGGGKNDKEEENPEHAAGPAQVDYVRRLAATIRNRHPELTAIGLLGTDVYDKLLLLRALRPTFPSAVFFTTDLDARLLEPSERQWTRNLIVASHCGLEASHRGLEHEERVFPFRGSYQTAVFRATRAALGEPIGPYTGFEPRVYEISRARAYDLSDKPGDGVHAASPRFEMGEQLFRKKKGFWILCCVVSALALLALVSPALARGKHLRVRAAVLTLVAAAALAVVVLWRSLDPDGEPFALLEGISVWPTCILRIAVIGLCIYYHFAARRRLLGQNARIAKDYFESDPQAAEPATDGPGTLEKAGEEIKLLMASIRRQYVRQPAAEEDAPEAKEVWDEYMRRSRPTATWARIHLFTALFTLFCVAFMLTSDRPWASPVRGVVDRWIESGTFWLSAAALFLLVFYVLDRTLFCLRFVAKISRNDVSWPPQKVQALAWEKQVPDSVAAELLKLELIERRTNTVGRLVYYPFVVLLALIVIHNSVFDNFPTTRLAGLVGVIFAMLVLLGILLRGVANRAERRAVRRLRQDVDAQRETDLDAQKRLEDLEAQKKLEKPDTKKRKDLDAKCEELEAQEREKRAKVEALEKVVDDMEEHRKAAFGVLASPVVRALLIPGGGLGLLQITEALARQ